MSRNNPRGLVEHRNLGGRVAPITRRRKTKAAHLNNALYAGDLVWRVSGDAVDRWPQTTVTAGAPPVLGVVRAVLNSDGRPFTHNLPSTPPRIPASTAGFVDVNEDPDQTYLISTDATATSGMVGLFGLVSANAPNTAAGRSGTILPIANTAVTASGGEYPVQVIGIGANNLDGWVANEANQDLEVIIANHAWRNFGRKP
jgi:hypothetical protein